MATNTYVALQTQVLGSAAASVTFSSIPQGYTDLVLVYNGTVTATGKDVRYQVNGDTASTNYSYTVLNGNGTSATSARYGNSAYIGSYQSNGTSSTAATIMLHFMNYSNTTTYKTTLGRVSDAGAEINAHVGMWRSTAAINTILIYPNTNTFASGDTFTLYGIAAEGQGYATGGYITSDANYYYHAFTSSGTFTPSKALTADILVVAGGGGGGRTDRAGGGGGAGGLLAFTSQSLTSGTGYTCTVGAGGAASTGSTVAGSQGVGSQFGALTATVGGGFGGGGNGAGGTGTGGTGGSGGGNGHPNFSTTSSATSGQGNVGGLGNNTGGNDNGGGGGGGAGAAGGNAATVGVGGVGGAGTNAYSSWLSATGLGVSGYIAGGGAGSTVWTSNPTAAAGGAGGGGAGGAVNTTTIIANATNGVANTGAGGGGGTGSSNGNATAGAGGSGIIIVRYAK